MKFKYCFVVRSFYMDCLTTNKPRKCKAQPWTALVKDKVAFSPSKNRPIKFKSFDACSLLNKQMNRFTAITPLKIVFI